MLQVGGSEKLLRSIRDQDVEVVEDYPLGEGVQGVVLYVSNNGTHIICASPETWWSRSLVFPLISTKEPVCFHKCLTYYVCLSVPLMKKALHAPS